MAYSGMFSKMASSNSKPYASLALLAMRCWNTPNMGGSWFAATISLAPRAKNALNSLTSAGTLPRDSQSVGVSNGGKSALYASG